MREGNIGYDPDEYAKSKNLPFRKHVEQHTLFTLIGNPIETRILDAGCGEGIYARRLIDLGAKHVI